MLVMCVYVIFERETARSLCFISRISLNGLICFNIFSRILEVFHAYWRWYLHYRLTHYAHSNLQLPCKKSSLLAPNSPAMTEQDITGQATHDLQGSTGLLSENSRNDWIMEAEMRRRNLLAEVFRFRSHSNIFSCRKWSSHCCSHNSMIFGVARLESTWKQWIRVSNLSASFWDLSLEPVELKLCRTQNPDSVGSQTDPTFWL